MLIEDNKCDGILKILISFTIRHLPLFIGGITSALYNFRGLKSHPGGAGVRLILWYHMDIMESYKRPKSPEIDNLNLFKKPDQLDNAKKNLEKDIRCAIEFLNNEINDNYESLRANNLLGKYDLSREIFAVGFGSEVITRGALEYIRILPILASMVVGGEYLKHFEELSQLGISYVDIDPDNDPNPDTKDLRVFASLGQFGVQNDQYNEQINSSDYQTLIAHSTKIGDFYAYEVALWASSK